MSNDISQNNKRIAKNTLALYFRTFITMIVGLYTGRVMLQALGVDNYGINATIGGIVGMTSLITGAMSGSISRFITVALGSNVLSRQKVVFSTSVNVQILLSLLIFFVLEIFGVWFLNAEAKIPAGRIVAAHWVLQCGIVTTVLGLLGSPYNAAIIAHEHMSIYAYMSIIDAVAKLGICFMVMNYNGDCLILFALLQMIIQIIVLCFYMLYCHRHFTEVSYSVHMFDKPLFKEMTVFSGWSFMNHSAWVFSTQGVNMLINVFFGVAFNAARGIAVTVNGAIQGFVGSFSMAFGPQIVKSYAAGDYEYVRSLNSRGTKCIWFLMCLLAIPIIAEADTLLYLWLGDVPDYFSLFLRLTMIESLAVQSGALLLRIIQADGRMHIYSLRASLVIGLIFPLTWLWLYLDGPIWCVYIVSSVVFLLINIVRYISIRAMMPFPIWQHIKECLCPCAVVTVMSAVGAVAMCNVMEPSVLRFFIAVPSIVLWIVFNIYVFGLSHREREFVKQKIQGVIIRIKL